MELEISWRSLDNLHLREDWESKNTLPSFSHSPSLHHTHIQTFLFPFSVPIAPPLPITMTLVSSLLLSLHSLPLSLALPPAGFISGPAQCPTVMS